MLNISRMHGMFSAVIMGVLTSLVRIFAEQLDPVKPSLKSDLTDIPWATLPACY